MRKCYNAPKSHWLGWYQKRQHYYGPPWPRPSKLVELVGLADYNETMTYGSAETQAVVLRIDMYEERSLCTCYLFHVCDATYTYSAAEVADTSKHVPLCFHFFVQT